MANHLPSLTRRLFRFFLRRRKGRFLAATLAMLLLVWFAPALVAHTPLRHVVAARILSDLRGTVRVGSASLGWFAPVVLRDVEVRDADGRALLAAPRVESRKSLLALLANRSDLGGFRFEAPSLHVVFRGRQSNLEQVCAAWLAADNSPPAPEGLGLEVEVVNARVMLQDADAARQWALSSVNLSVILPRQRTNPIRVALRADLPQDGRPGSANVDFETHLLQPAGGRLAAQFDSVPLALAAPLLRRAEPAAQLDGRLDGRLECRWDTSDKDGPHIHLEGQLAGQGLTAAGPWLGGERLRLERLDVPFRAALRDGRWHVEQAEVRCDLGQASVSGTLDPADVLTRSRGQVRADLDLARLAQALPQALRLRADTHITAGRVQLSLSAADGAHGPAWQGELLTSALTAVSQGQQYAWREPLTITARAHQPAGAPPVVDQLLCRSSFLTLEASGSPDRFAARADYDLGRLAAELSRFVNLGPVRLAGRGTAQVEAGRGEDGRVTARGQGQLSQFELAGRGGGPWREERLAWRLDAAGRASGGCYRLDSGRLRLEGNHDLAELQLLEPVADVLGGRWGAARLQVRGDLALWQHRLRPLLDGAGPLAGKVAGQVDLTPVAGRLGAQVDLAFQDLVVGPPASPSWREPKVRVQGRGHYDPAADLVQIDQLQVDGQALGGTAQGQLTKLSGSRDVLLTGRLRCDLEKLTAQLRPALGNGVQVSGQDERPFRLEGSLTPARPADGASVVPGPVAALTGEASLGWKSATLYGFPVGPADLRARLDKGWLRAEPVEAAVSGGRLRLEPSLRLEPGPPELHVAAGTVLDHVRMTSALCDNWLAYVAPVLARVTDVDGQFSVALDGARLPLDAPAKAQTAGRLAIHSARISSSPLLRELSVLLKGPPSLSLTKEAVVSFQVIDGRVHHRDLALVFPEVTVRTSGSVGFDGSLALVAEMPVPPTWLGAGRVSAALAKQTVRLPIGGTLDRPKLDEKALRAASAQFVRDTAGEVLRQELDRQLEKLIRPR